MGQRYLYGWKKGKRHPHRSFCCSGGRFSGLCDSGHRNQCLSSRKRFSRRTQKYSRSCFFRSHGRRQKPPGRRVSQLFYGAVPVFGGQLLYTGIPGTQFPYREGNPCPSSGRNKKSFCPGCRWGMPADRPV